MASSREAGAEEAAAYAAPGLEALARFGYVSKGVIYGVIGVLALSVVLGWGGVAADTQGALLRLQDLPLGTPLLWLLALGLLGYALWQLIRAFLDPEHQGRGARGLAKRAGYLLSALANSGLALFAVRLAWTGHARRDEHREVEVARQVLDWPGGQVLLALAGLVLLAVAGSAFYSASGARFMKRMALTELGTRSAELVKRVGQVGIAARGVVLAIIAVFLLLAAWRGRAGSVRGIAEVFSWLRAQPAGPLLLGVVALGTLCYGWWCLIQARYRRVRVQP
ncbi:DUF1206 domain-containing protein [Deinococcus sp. YIM 77859]|uniref:DUF1206 domain-containing protein n=1 Tax=Deinococcus sp. YIM 77859 TaxID=1540221 RepID=UPI000557BBA9|nr:DUF1206 domain-containing protein [Deinococcus sp. YIM 77859]